MLKDLERMSIGHYYLPGYNSVSFLMVTTSCSTDEVVLNHKIYLELYIFQVVKNPLFISS